MSVEDMPWTRLADQYDNAQEFKEPPIQAKGRGKTVFRSDEAFSVDSLQNLLFEPQQVHVSEFTLVEWSSLSLSQRYAKEGRETREKAKFNKTVRPDGTISCDPYGKWLMVRGGCF
jgi:hypothetical protein